MTSAEEPHHTKSPRNRIRIHYLRAGDAKKPTLILLHGMAGVRATSGTR